MANANRDQNRITTLIATSSADGTTPVNVWADPVTHRILTDTASGSGTVTSVSVITANGFAGSVATATTTPAITLSTTITGVLVGNGTAVAAAVSGTDFKTVNSTSILGSGNIATGTVTTASVVTNAGISGTVATATTTPAITLSVATQSAGDNTTNAATTAFVTTAVANAIAGQNPAVSVSAATTTSGNTSAWTYNNGASGIGATFTGPVNTAIVIDGITFTALTQSLLVKNDTQSPSGAFNGIYNLTALQTGITGAIFTRRLDYDTPTDINNTGAIPVVGGTVNALTSWLQTSNIVTVGTTPLTYSQFSYSPTTVITPQLGGTGVANNSASTLTISGSFGTTLTVSGTTALTLPTSGTVTAQGNSVTGSGNIVLSASPALTGIPTAPQILNADNAIATVSNAATVTRSNRNNVVTNNSAAGITITLSTSGATGGDMILIESLPSSAVAQAITWVNTETSDVTPSANLNASTTSPRTDGFKWNPLTSKWRCIASA